MTRRQQGRIGIAWQRLKRYFRVLIAPEKEIARLRVENEALRTYKHNARDSLRHLQAAHFRLLMIHERLQRDQALLEEKRQQQRH